MKIENPKIAHHIIFLTHYFPPINSSGARRIEALSKYLSRSGRKITVITTKKNSAHGEFTEPFPEGVEVLQINWVGRVGESVMSNREYEPMYTGNPSFRRKLKDICMRWFGQLPDPRFAFALSILNPVLDLKVRKSIEAADVIIGSSPPWPMLMAALFAHWRFRIPFILDYRDHFSECHEMPGSKFAKRLERTIDMMIAKRARALVTISEPMAKYYSKFNPNVSIIMNGYDNEAIERAKAARIFEKQQNNKLIIVRYFGIISPGRVPKNLLLALSNLQRNGKKLESFIRFEFYGSHDILEMSLHKEFQSLVPLFEFKAAVPYKEALELMINADFLLFSETSSKSTLSSQGILTTKLFEYIGSGRPIIADISPETIAGRMIRRSGNHHFVSNKVKDFENYMESKYFLNPISDVDADFVKSISRVFQAEQYRLLLDKIIQNT